ncbi:hypothetical protein SPRA44_250055 [Serratia proteamaculans]|nr:hypothetical protein SPRA44_250055 [Serratia proteamaculans]
MLYQLSYSRINQNLLIFLLSFGKSLLPSDAMHSTYLT